MSSTVLREFCEADAQEINRLAVTAFEEFGCNYSDWPALAAFYGKMSDLAKSGEIVVGTRSSQWDARIFIKYLPASIGLARGPDSPPTIAQWMSLRSGSTIGPNSGSKETKRTRAGTRRKMSMRSRWSWLPAQPVPLPLVGRG